MSDDIVGFDPDEVGNEEEEKFGQALKELAKEDVTIENFENFLRRVKSRSGQIKDDIKELQKENKRIQQQMDQLKDDVGEEKLEAYRQDGNKDLKDFSIDTPNSLAARKYRNLKKIENKRSYKTAHWRLVSSKLNEIVDDIGTIDKAVKRHTDSVQAEIVKELEGTEDNLVGAVEDTEDSLSRELSTITRRTKSIIQMIQEMAQYLSISSVKDIYSGSIDDDQDQSQKDEAGGGRVEESSSESSNGTLQSSSSDEQKKSTKEKFEDTTDESEDDQYVLTDKRPREKKKVLDRMVEEVDGIQEMKKSDIVPLVDVSRQMLYYSGDYGGIIGQIENQFEDAEYPELK